ncbi:AbrB/MazE/SpoVT family DNA-binding domain-containing protein [Ekhidna sp.]|uniref:AbrB/MazE/SpoVT family DNA-binding domain-containing protein n=1 Tax=Ekhidna sp. TaxID=2608089 RepID=UPI003CCBE1AC
MDAKVGKITSKGQTTIPKSVRDRLKLKSGDRVIYVDSEEGVLIKKLESGDIPYLKFLDDSLGSEWNSLEDNTAFNDL